MKISLRAAAAAAALALAAPAVAQQDTNPRVGVGVSLNTSLLGPFLTLGNSVFAPPSNVYVPIYVTPNVRLEPQLGWLSVTDDEEDVTNRSFSLGIGALFVKPVVQTTNLYAGVRLASTWLKEEDRVSASVVGETTQRNTTFSAVFGGEWLPSPWFSLGVEVQLEYTALGDPEFDAGGTTVEGQGGSATATQGLIFTRVYFM